MISWSQHATTKLSGKKDAVNAIEVLDSLRKSETEVRSPRWTDEETKVVKEKFKYDIAQGKTPSLKSCSTLNLNDQNPKQIQDKVRTLICQGRRN